MALDEAAEQSTTCQQGDEMATRDQRDKLSAGIGADHDLSWMGETR